MIMGLFYSFIIQTISLKHDIDLRIKKIIAITITVCKGTNFNIILYHLRYSSGIRA
jgi:phage shock protein PspC (stress-responsive transcriptional regulator)